MIIAEQAKRRSAKVIPLQRGQFRREHRLGTNRSPVGLKEIQMIGGGDPSILFEALFFGDRLNRILALIVIVVILNFFAFFVISMSIGGDALNGRVVNGHYYLGPGKLKEVSPALFAYSRWHGISLAVTFPPAMLLVFVLKRRLDAHLGL